MAHEPIAVDGAGAPVLRFAWTDPRLATGARATREAPTPIEMLAARIRRAAQAWGGERGLVWLDSGARPATDEPAKGGGPARAAESDAESVLSAFPSVVRRWRGPADGELGTFLDALVSDAPLPAASATGTGRFRAGWLGFLSYEAGADLEPVTMRAARDVPVPVASWARHDIWFRHVPAERRLELWSSGAMDANDANRPDLSAWLHWGEEALRAPGDNTTPMWSPPPELMHVAAAPADAAERLAEHGRRSLPRAAFMDAVRQVKRAIREGEVFQANVAQRVSLAADVDPFAVYIQLRRLNPSPFACFIEEDWGALVSNSPERLFQVSAPRHAVSDVSADAPLVIRARPIAGTCPRSADPHEDAAQVARLASSAKERAEHTMLVDLVRNDVGRVAEPGSVKVSEFQHVEAYSHVHHLVSDVEGRLPPGTRFQDVVRAMFPGGTITGAPKLRSIEVIDRVEPVMRGPYTGSAGYVNGDGTADWNILIRTLVWTRDVVHAYAGAGVVADSDPGREFEETLHKAAAMLGAFATVRAATGESSEDGATGRAKVHSSREVPPTRTVVEGRH